IASSYYNDPRAPESFTEDGWLRTGDVASIDRHGYIRLRDRTKDVIKSGGEWSGSVELENEIMAHPAVAEAAVIGLPHPKWGERPLACVVLREGQQTTKQDIVSFLQGRVAKWWLPDDVVFIDSIPKTSVGKFSKKDLRDGFADYTLPTAWRPAARVGDRPPPGRASSSRGRSPDCGARPAPRTAPGGCAGRRPPRRRPTPACPARSGRRPPRPPAPRPGARPVAGRATRPPARRGRRAGAAPPGRPPRPAPGPGGPAGGGRAAGGWRAGRSRPRRAGGRWRPGRRRTRDPGRRPRRGRPGGPPSPRSTAHPGRGARPRRPARPRPAPGAGA